MLGNRKRDRSILPLSIVPILALWGCVEYQIETTVDEDGGGFRSERVEVDAGDDADFDVPPETFTALMHFGSDAGWRHEADPDDETKHVFSRERQIRGLTSWTELDHTVRISAAASGEGNEAGLPFGGDPRYADVRFWNSVQVETGRREAGRTLRYREEFYWENLIGVLIDFELDEFRRTLRDRYPRLDGLRMGEVIGLVKGALWTTVEDGRWEMGSTERASAYGSLVEALALESVRLVRTDYPGATADDFLADYRRLFVEPDTEQDEKFERFLEKEIPGANLAGNTEITFRLNMPGEVVESNAHERDKSTLIWKFSPWDALSKPVQILAESRLDGNG